MKVFTIIEEKNVVLTTDNCNVVEKFLFGALGTTNFNGMDFRFQLKYGKVVSFTNTNRTIQIASTSMRGIK